MRATNRGSLSCFCIAAALLVSTGCQGEKSATAAARTDPAQARQVRVATAVEENVARSIEVSGTLAAEDQVQLGMRVTGRITELPVDLGSRVAKGQLIARIDPTEFRLLAEQAAATLEQARNRLGLSSSGSHDRVKAEDTSVVRQGRAMLNEARTKLDRAKQLLDQKLIPQSEFDAAQAAFLVAEGRYEDALEEIRNRQAILSQRRSDLELAKQRQADTELHSPIAGAVSERLASVGQYVQAGAPVVTIVQIHPLRLRLAVPERAAAGVAIGQQVNVRVEGDPTVYQGRVARVSPSIDVTNRTLLVEATVPNDRGRLRPGAFARAEMITQSALPAVLIPATAIVTFAGIQKVMTVENNRSVEKHVQTGRRYADRVEIAQGLKPGEQVVIRPGNLVGGQPVAVQR